VFTLLGSDLLGSCSRSVRGFGVFGSSAFPLGFVATSAASPPNLNTNGEARTEKGERQNLMLDSSDLWD